MTDNASKYHKKKHLSFLVFKTFGTRYRNIHKNIKITFNDMVSFLSNAEKKQIAVCIGGKTKYFYPLFSDIFSFLFENKHHNIYLVYYEIECLILENKCNLGAELGYGMMNIP